MPSIDRLPKYETREWKDEHVQNIASAEIFPAAVARWTWEHVISNRRAIYFIDNESARLALVKSYSPILPSLRLIMLCLEWDQEWRYALVRSSSYLFEHS